MDLVRLHVILRQRFNSLPGTKLLARCSQRCLLGLGLACVMVGLMIGGTALLCVLVAAIASMFEIYFEYGTRDVVIVVLLLALMLVCFYVFLLASSLLESRRKSV